MELTNLTELGLTDGQIRVYSAILELGNPNLNSIHEKTGIERRNIYDILNKLIEKALISYIDDNKSRKYRCTPTSKIMQEIRDKESRLKNLELELPSIAKIMESTKSEVNAQIYRGNEGFKNLFEEMLEYKESYWLGGNSFENYTAFSESFFAWFENWMHRRLVKKHVMFDLVSHGTNLRGLKSTTKQAYYHYKQLPKDMYIPIVICIFGDKVAQISWSEKFAFVMQSKMMKDGFMKYFNYFWKK